MACLRSGMMPFRHVSADDRERHACDPMSPLSRLFFTLAVWVGSVGVVWSGVPESASDRDPYPREAGPVQMIRDLRKDLKTPNLPVVIGELGVSGKQGDFQLAQKGGRRTRRSERQRSIRFDPPILGA